MLAVTGGKERTIEDWRTLLTSARFEIGEVAMTGMEARHAVIEAIPA
jgi:hypothetical protein